MGKKPSELEKTLFCLSPIMAGLVTGISGAVIRYAMLETSSNNYAISEYVTEISKAGALYSLPTIAAVATLVIPIALMQD